MPTALRIYIVRKGQISGTLDPTHETPKQCIKRVIVSYTQAPILNSSSARFMTFTRSSLFEHVRFLDSTNSSAKLS